MATGSVSNDTPITAVFGDNWLTGHVGGNTYNTTYSNGVDTITIEKMRTTTMISAQRVVDQKRLTCRRSSRPATYEFREKTLDLYAANESVLVSFKAAE